MIVTIHQPESFPWLGFFHKMYLADVYVFLDTVQFEKNSVQNRNKIKVGNTARWLTLPLADHSSKEIIKNIEINWLDEKFCKKHLATLQQSYSKHPYFEEVFPFLRDLYTEKLVKLVDFNSKFILFFVEKLGIETKIINASDLKLSGKAVGGTEVTLEICKLLEADIYISGKGGRSYLDLTRYSENNIEVYFQEFTHPKYSQIGSLEFVPHLSIFDLYCNHGPKSMDIILEGNVRSLK